MSSDQGLGSGERHIIPSARRGIHSGVECMYPTRKNMARFAEDSSEDERPQAGGTDEVDNVMSKIVRTSSPLAMKKRRNSMTPPNQQYTDDSDDDAIAKSLPATLPSYSHCSDDWNGHGSSISNQHSNSDFSSLRSRTNRSTDSNLCYSRSTLSLKLNQSRKDDKKTILKYLLALLAACSVAYYYDLMKPIFESNQSLYDELKFHKDLTELGVKYKVGDNSMLQLFAGVSTIFRRKDTSCFIFVYNSMTENFNLNQFDGFVHSVAYNTAKFLRNESASVQHLTVDGSDLTMGSHTHLVKAFREDMTRDGVLLIKDLEDVPSPLAMAFHYYCDEYNPLVKRSAVFFTLDAARCHNSDEQSSHASIEKCLKEKWHTVPRDNIGPLLTRVVSVVVDVTKWY